jgi:predicted DNA-binding transcriptional regulator YafY
MSKSKNSHRGNLTERMILIPLKLAERPHTKQELVKLCDVDAKTIVRDIDALTPYHPIDSEKDGREVRYFFLEGYKYTPPNFTPAELATLLLAQRSIAATGLTSFGTALAGYGELLLQKVRSALPNSLRDKLDALSTIYGTAQVPAKDYAPHAATIDQLTTAAMERRRVRMRYYTLHNDKTSERNCDPYAVYFDPDGATLKVIGHDHQSGEIRPFSIDHIRHLQILTERFTRPADWDLQNFLTKYCFNGMHGEPLTVRLRAHNATARVFAERQFHPTQQTIAQTSTTTTIEMTVARGRGLVRFILSWMPDVEVLSPPQLQQEITETLQKSLQRQE